MSVESKILPLRYSFKKLKTLVREERTKMPGAF
jgi:hypothetical protein